jgi:iron complex outermembrane receptor protein
MKTALLTSAATALFCCLIQVPAYAQSESAEENTGDIVVTARKQSETLLDIPDTIQAFSTEKLQRAGVSSIGDLTQLVSGFRLVEAQQPGVVLINIRGVGQVRNGESPIAVVIDGVQQHSPNQITQDLFDIQQIEILKGPQGALYGRNAIGGAINIVTRPPSDHFEGRVEVGYAEGDEWRLRGSISSPLGEKASFRLAASYMNRDGQILNTTLGQKVDFDESWAIRGALTLKPVETLSIDLRGSYFDQKAGASWYVSGPVNAPREPVVGNLLGKAKRKLGDASAKIDLELGGATLTSVSAWSSVKSDLFEELDWLPLDLAAATQTLDVTAWSEELRLSSSQKDARLRWMAGVYYLGTSRTQNTGIFLQPGLTGLPAPISGGRLIAHDNNNAYAVFGQLNYRLAEALELTAALRYDIDQRHQTDLTPPTPTSPTQFRSTYRSLQPKFSLAYSLSDSTRAYFTAAKGFRSGGFNSNAVVTREFRKEELWNYEVGFKTSFGGSGFYLNGALFYTDISDRQVAGLDLTTGPAQFIANPIPKSSVKGAEIEFSARPVKGLELSFGGSLMDTKIRKYDTRVFAGTAANGDFTGNKLSQVPEYTVNAAVQYGFEIDKNSRLVSRFDVSGWGGKYYWEIDNRDKQNPVWLANGRISWVMGDYELSVFGKNLFNRRYDLEFVPVAFSGNLTGQDLGAAAPRRQFGVNARARF